MIEYKKYKKININLKYIKNTPKIQETKEEQRKKWNKYKTTNKKVDTNRYKLNYIKCKESKYTN